MKSKLPPASSVVGLAFARAIARLEDLEVKFRLMCEYDEDDEYDKPEIDRYEAFLIQNKLTSFTNELEFMFELFNRKDEVDD